MTHPFFLKKPVVLAHRGDSIYFPENTMPAFLSAAELGVDCIETDVHLTKDGQCVIWHDDTLKSLTGSDKRICSKTLKELKEIDAGGVFSPDNGKTFPFRNKGITMVSLGELLETIPNMKFNVDLKDRSNKLVKEFCRVLRDQKAENRVLGGSFHHDNIIHLRKILPELATSFSEVEARRIVMLNKTGILRFFPLKGAQALQVPESAGKIKVVTKSLIKRLHKKNIAVQVWTVNEKEDMIRLLNMGVDGIFTDNPRMLMEVVNKAPANIF